jgi:hypothetical protein
MMTKDERIAYDKLRMTEAFQKLIGKEAKMQNILEANGVVPAAVLKELADAELEYGFWKAMWKDDETDPYL